MWVQDKTEKELFRYKPEQELLTIVVHAYGRIDKTKQCVEHILRYAKGVPHTLILSDNGTPTDELLDYYRSVKHPKKKITRIEKNETSIKGMNPVLRQIETKYILLVMNDTYLTPGALENLMVCMESDPKIAFVSPVSSNTPCAQGESLGGFSGDEEMIKKAEKFNKSNPRLWAQRMRIGPQAALLRRTALEKVGLFDDDYMHEYGDDDLCIRLRRAGYKLILCRDTFVHHDHLRTDYSNEYVLERTRNGAALIKQKFHVDPDQDTLSVAQHIQRVAREESHTAKKVLAVNPGCGTPCLDLRNYYNRQGITDVEVYAFSREARFYADLCSVADHVVIDRMEFISEHYSEEMFDFIVCCQSNGYIEDIGRRFVKKDGILLMI